MNEKNDNLTSRYVVLVPLKSIDAAYQVAQKFNLNATYEHHPALAMAEICLIHQQAKSSLAWNGSAHASQLLLVQTDELLDVQSMIDSIRKYLPHVRISELRDGRIERIENHDAIVDSLEEPPVIHSEAIDADELSMLLDNTPQEADE